MIWHRAGKITVYSCSFFVMSLKDSLIEGLTVRGQFHHVTIQLQFNSDTCIWPAIENKSILRDDCLFLHNYFQCLSVGSSGQSLLKWNGVQTKGVLIYIFHSKVHGKWHKRNSRDFYVSITQRNYAEEAEQKMKSRGLTREFDIYRW